MKVLFHKSTINITQPFKADWALDEQMLDLMWGVSPQAGSPSISRSLTHSPCARDRIVSWFRALILLDRIPWWSESQSSVFLDTSHTCAKEAEAEVFDLIKSRANSREHYNIKMRTVRQEFLHSARLCNRRRTLTIFLRPFIEATRRLLRNSRMRTCFSAIGIQQQALAARLFT